MTLYHLQLIYANTDCIRRKENQGNTNLFQQCLNRFCIVIKEARVNVKIG